MNDNTKQRIKNLFWSVFITVINGLITIFNPETEKVAFHILNSISNC